MSQTTEKDQSPCSQGNKEGKVIPNQLADLASARPRFESIWTALQEGRQIAINFEASSNCNLACSFCGMHSNATDLDIGGVGKLVRKDKHHLRRELFDEFVEKMVGLPPLKVMYFHGHGEPLLNKRLADMIRTVKTLGITESVVIVTNGTLLTVERFQELAEAGVAEVRVSLDVITPEVYKKVKGVDMAEQVVANVLACLERLRNSDITMRLTVETMHWKDTNSPLYQENQLIEARLSEEFSRTPNAILRWREEFNWLEQMGQAPTEYRRNRPCEQPFFMLMIHADGVVSACCADSAKGLVVGDLRQASHMRDIMQGSALRELRKKTLEEDFSTLPQCRSCDAKSVVEIELRHRKHELLNLI